MITRKNKNTVEGGTAKPSRSATASLPRRLLKTNKAKRYVPQSPLAVALLFLVVFFCCCLLLPFRDARWLNAGLGKRHLESATVANFCDNLPLCLRLLSAYDQLLVYKALVSTADLLHLDKSIDHAVAVSQRYASFYRSAELIYRFIFFGLTLVLAAYYLMPTILSQIALPLFSMLTLVGWGHAGIVEHVGILLYTDYPAFGFLLLYAIFLAKVQTPTLWMTIPLAVFAQLHFNHLGILLTIALTGFMWIVRFHTDRWRYILSWLLKGLVLLAACLLATYLTKKFVGLYVEFLEADRSFWTHILKVYHQYARFNFDRFYHEDVLWGGLVEYFIIHTQRAFSWGIPLGMASGAYFGWKTLQKKGHNVLETEYVFSLRVLLAASSIVLAYAVCLVPAMFTSGIWLETGRQSSHLMLVINLFCIKFGETMALLFVYLNDRLQLLKLAREAWRA